MHGYGPDTPELGSGAKMIDGFSARSVHERVGFCSFTSLTCHEKGRGYSLMSFYVQPHASNISRHSKFLGIVRLKAA